MTNATSPAIAYEVNCETGEITERKRTPEELATEALERAELAKKEAAEAALVTKKDAAKQALLEKLGITADEAKLLLS